MRLSNELNKGGHGRGQYFKFIEMYFYLYKVRLCQGQPIGLKRISFNERHLVFRGYIK